MTAAGLDPLTTSVFLAIFVVCALLAKYRPALGAGALLLADPFALSRAAFGTTVTIPKVALLGVLLGLCSFAGNSARLRAYPAALLAGAILFYALATAASLPGAEYAAPALRETLKAFQYLACFIAAYLCLRLDPEDGAVVNAVAIATILVACSALAQEFTGAPSALCIGAKIVPRVAGLLEGPNQLSGYLEIAVAILGAWAVRRPAALTSAALGLAVAAGVLTFSRAGFAALIVVLAVVIFVWRVQALRLLWAAWLGLAAAWAYAGAWLSFAHGVDVLRLSLDESLCAGGVGNRGQLWPAALRMWLARPAFGIGAGNFEFELPLYGVLGVRTHANSWYLQSLAEGGVALFAATVTLVAAVLSVFARALRERSPWVLAAFAASLALALHQIVDYVVYYPKVGSEWFVLLGLGAAAIASKRAA